MSHYRDLADGWATNRGGGPAPRPPVNIALPAITGTARTGSTLTVSDGSWANSPTAYARQWKADGVNINGATGATYVPVSGDIGKVITCTVTASNADGSEAATTAGTAPVAAQPPVNIALPAITGTARTGSTLTVSNGSWENSPTAYARQWKAAGVNISGAMGTTYVPVLSDVGKVITCTVTASNADGSEAATSAGTAAVVAQPVPVNSTTPVMTGTPAVGQTMSCTTGAWSNSPTSYEKRWRVAGVQVELSDNYVIRAEDVGKAILCRVRAFNSGGGSAQVDSNSMTVTG